MPSANNHAHPGRNVGLMIRHGDASSLFSKPNGLSGRCLRLRLAWLAAGRRARTVRNPWPPRLSTKVAVSLAAVLMLLAMLSFRCFLGDLVTPLNENVEFDAVSG